MSEDWGTANHEYLLAELDRVRSRFDDSLGTRDATEIMSSVDTAPALVHVTELFGLTPFERDILLLCAGVELDYGFADACRRAQCGRGVATFSLALAALEDPHWSALAPTGPLRYWRLVELAGEEGLVNAALRIDERVLHHLAGVDYPDERLHGTMRRWEGRGDLPPSHLELARGIASVWGDGDAAWSPVALCGNEDAGLEDIAAAACAAHGLVLNVVRAADLPAAPADVDALARIWDREAALARSGLLILVEDDDEREAARRASAFLECVQGACVVAGREPLRLRGRTLPRFDAEKPRAEEQVELWRRALGEAGESLNGEIDRLVSQFDLGAAAIASAGAVARRNGADATKTTAGRLWDSCRSQSRSRLDDLAQRVHCTAPWEDLVLPPQQLSILREIPAHVRNRARVHGEWGFGGAGSRGLGVSALFAGPSGTGKTLAAEILANELDLDLYRVDLSQVVSKYIGETERNLRRVFDGAEAAGAVLLFDEADALFGKRSEVKDSHDRYANIEVSYLLQRMEAYRGLAVLTTNMRQALDPAFTRRIRFVVQFPFPDTDERAAIWERIFPAETPTDGLDAARLARLNVAGGNIRNIALGAAFLAADAGRPVAMTHILSAARSEYAKLDRPLTDAEIAGWT